MLAIVARTLRLPVESVTKEQSFEDLKADSLDATNIVFQVEDEFAMRVPDHDMMRLRTVRNLVDCIEQRIRAQSAAS